MLTTRSLSSHRGAQPCRQALRQHLAQALKPGRLQRSRALPDQQPRSSRASRTAKQTQARTVVLPGALWLLSEDGWASIPVQGEGFIMQRGNASQPAEEGGNTPVSGGLVPYIRHPTGMAVSRVEPMSLGAMAAALPLVTVPILPNDTCTGIVPWVDPELEGAGANAVPGVRLAGAAQLHGLAMSSALAGRQEGLFPLDEHAGVFETHTHSPRRTKKVKFTCGRCGATNIKPINPHAYSEGSVFAKCGKCSVTHKLIDNLKLFHELSGPVYEVPSPTTLDALLPERLRLRLPKPMDQQES